MRLFNFRPARATARPALTRAFGSVSAPHGDWPSGYEAQVRAAYLGNAVAQRAVRIVAEGAGSVTIDATPDDHPASALLSGSLVETIATHLLLHGRRSCGSTRCFSRRSNPC